MSDINEEGSTTMKKPPYPSPGHADRLFELFRRITPQRIDSKFVADNNITTTSNASQVVKLAEWFKLIDADGNVIPKNITKLKLAGNERDQYIVEMIQNSYKDLLEHVDLQNATKNDVTNYFVHNYDYSARAAEAAAIVFLHMCQTYGMPMSDKLKKKVYTPSGEPRARPAARVATPKASSVQEPAKQPQPNMIGIVVEGKRHDFDLQNSMDKVVFKALTDELLKSWGKKISNDTEGDSENNNE